MVVAAGLAALAVRVVATLTEHGPQAWWAHDVYTQYYPSLLYALRALHEGGRGLLWNPFQNCGQPFFGISLNGLLYPANVLFLVLPAGAALRGVLAIDLLAGGLFAYALARELGVGPLGALGGAVAFELGNASLELASWCPYVLGPYVWLPAAMLFAERILRVPTVRAAIALGVVLAVALLPGFPQTVFFIYQLVFLRVVWEAASGRLGRRAIALVAVGLVLAPLLAAVQLVPGLEVARASMRNARLTLDEISPGGLFDWHAFRTAMVWRDSFQEPLAFLPCLVAPLGLFGRDTRRHAAFYLAAGILYFFLAFPNLPLFQLYMRLPLGTAFRIPARFLFVPSFSLSVLTALGIEAIASAAEPRRGVSRSLGMVLAPVLALVGFRLLTSLSRLETIAAGVAVAASAAAAFLPERRRWAAVGVVAAVVVDLVWAPPTTWMRLLPSDASLFAHAAVFARLRARMTPQDRVLVVHGPVTPSRFVLMPKDGSLFGVRSIQDYELQASRRYAEYFVRMHTGGPMTSLNQVTYSWRPSRLERPLFDLTAARYLVVEAGDEDRIAAFRPAPALVEDTHDVRVYENHQALPRAFWVPRVEVVPDPAALLDRLARAGADPRDVALVERPPPSGFTGVAGSGRGGTVEFLRDDPEHVVLRVRAPKRGFVSLADQDFPGWRATVGGHPSPIVRANYVFRLVEVPPGDSVVDFRYEPMSVRIGAAVTLLTLLALGTFGLRSGLRRRRRNRHSSFS